MSGLWSIAPTYNFSDEKLAFASLGNRDTLLLSTLTLYLAYARYKGRGLFKMWILELIHHSQVCYCKLFFSKILLAKINFDARFCKKKCLAVAKHLLVVGMSGLEPLAVFLYSTCVSYKVGVIMQQKKQVEPAFAGWNEWTRTTDPHLIRVVL